MRTYYAHYDAKRQIAQTLKEHLRAVADMADAAVSPSISFQGAGWNEIRDMAWFIGLFHDLGKYSDHFQNYLLHGTESELKDHAHISACILYPLVMERLQNLDKKQRMPWAFLSYVAVRMHHGHLNLKSIIQEQMWKKLKLQGEHLKEKCSEIYEDLGLAQELDRESFQRLMHVDSLEQDKFFNYMPEYLMYGRFKDEQWYFALIYLFSLLIDADKLDSAGLWKMEPVSVPSQRITDYLRQKHGTQPETDIIRRRNQARESIVSSIASLTDEQIQSNRLFTITAPTGIGKTLASLQAALLLQERIRNIEGYVPKVLSALPYINIIEQTQKDYEKVFGQEAKVIIHHRFSDFHSNIQEQDERALDQKMLEVESWEGDVVLTTFVQLFQSLFTGKNRLLKKINKLAGSIVILDEVQAIPHQYMPLIGALIRKLAHHYGTRFILMTATQPKILELGDLLLGKTDLKPIELLPDHETYFAGLKRTKMIPLLEQSYTTEQFLTLFLEKWDRKESALIVVNTIKRSIDIFSRLKEMKINGEIPCDTELYYLSTNIVPKQRKQVIEAVKSKIGKEPLIMVSTQTIEAGVDLDFDLGFRDLAPLESLIQTAGRINREGIKGEDFPLYVVQIETDHRRVYSLHHLDRTKKLLKDYKEVFESQYRTLVETYYQELMKAGVSDDSRKIWEEGVKGLDFQVLNQFQLIQNIGEVVDVYVEMPDVPETSLLLDAYEEIKRDQWNPNALLRIFGESIKREAPTNFEKKTIMRILLNKMSQYMLQVRLIRAANNKPIPFEVRNGCEAPFYWIPPDQLEQYYDAETGFVDKGGQMFL